MMNSIIHSWHGHLGRGRTGFQPVFSRSAANAVLRLNKYPAKAPNLELPSGQEMRSAPGLLY